jgi:putative CocE/NonD family hydrolase
MYPMIQARLPWTLLIGLCVAVADASLAGGAEEYSKGPYQVRIERDVRVRMRDGVLLSADLYLPLHDGKPLAEKLPAVLQRTPYNKAPLEKMAAFFASHGYLSVTQDCRGRFESNGDFVAFVNEPNDGYDTIEWLAKHPACNGKVGMFGCSYLGWVQLQAATRRPPGLVTMIPFEGPTNGYHYSMHTGGAIHLGLLRWSLGMASDASAARRVPEAVKGIKAMASDQEFLSWAERIPWRRGQTPLAANPLAEDATFKLFFENQDYNGFWRQPGLAMDDHFASYPDIPILWVVGWYDWYPRSICDGYQKMVALGRANQALLVGPWTHNNFDSSCGEVQFGFDGGKVRSYDDYLHLELRWFDHWLKDDRTADIGRPVSYFVMGGGNGRRENGKLAHGGHWEYGDAWPPADCRPTEFYLHEPGTLARQPPSEPHSSTTYTYDPRNTVSSNSRCFIGFPALTANGGIGPHDQIELATLPGHGLPGLPIASRPDVLVFQTDTLTEAVKIAGNIRVVLYVSSDAPDTDFFVKLIDVYPASDDNPRGFAMPLGDGVLRARYRESFAKSKPMKAGEVYRLEIPLEPSANVFAAGHRIRVDIASSNFPGFDINRNTGNPLDRRWRIAENTVHHEAAHPSCIILPICPTAAK